jgi:hypothetical protein
MRAADEARLSFVSGFPAQFRLSVLHSGHRSERGGTYKKNAGSYVSTPGTVVNGDTITVRVTSSASASTAVSAVLTIGGVSDTYTVTTAA